MSAAIASHKLKKCASRLPYCFRNWEKPKAMMMMLYPEEQIHQGKMSRARFLYNVMGPGPTCQGMPYVEKMNYPKSKIMLKMTIIQMMGARFLEADSNLSIHSTMAHKVYHIKYPARGVEVIMNMVKGALVVIAAGQDV